MKSIRHGLLYAEGGKATKVWGWQKKYCTISINRAAVFADRFPFFWGATTHTWLGEGGECNNRSRKAELQKAKASPITKGRQTAVKLLFKRIGSGRKMWRRIVGMGVGEWMVGGGWVPLCEPQTEPQHRPSHRHSHTGRRRSTAAWMYWYWKSLWFFAAPLQTAIWQILSQSKSTADEILPGKFHRNRVTLSVFEKKKNFFLTFIRTFSKGLSVWECNFSSA